VCWKRKSEENTGKELQAKNFAHFELKLIAICVTILKIVLVERDYNFEFVSCIWKKNLKKGKKEEMHPADNHNGITTFNMNAAGDEQTDSTRSSEAMTWYPNHPIVASTGQRREQHSLVAGFSPNAQWKIAGELLYGKQEGSGDAEWVTGGAFTGATYKGFNGHLTYKASETIRYGLRYEIFKDPQGFALTPLGTPGATVQALTLGANIDLSKNIVLRPELRHDWAKTTDGGVKFFGKVPASSAATDNQQTTISADLLFYF
jgi:hypothetical protein